MARFWRFFWRFFGWLKDDAALRLPLDRIAPTRFLGLLQAISPESGVGSGNIPVLPDYPNFAPWSNFWRFSADSKTTLSSAYLWTELHQTRLPVFLQAIPPESGVGNGKTPLLADWHGFGVFFGVFSAGSKTTLPFAYPWTELHQTRFPVFLQAIPSESSVGNEKTPLLADWHGFGVFFGVFSAGSKTTLPFAYPGPNCTKLGFLGFCRPFHRNRVLEAETYQYYQITPILLPGATFGVFSADSKTKLSCAYLLTELHQTRFPVFLQAIPPESGVGNG